MRRLWCIIRRHPGAYGFRDNYGIDWRCDRRGRDWYKAQS